MLLHTFACLYIHIGMYYSDISSLSTSVGNNALTFEKRKNKWSDTKLAIPQLIVWTPDDVFLDTDSIAYEYVDEHDILHTSYGLQSLVTIDFYGKDLYIIDNHNHAFAMRWRSYLNWKSKRGSHLIHIDQHSDFGEPEEYLKDFDSTMTDIRRVAQTQIDIYTNEILTIGSFIKPALQCGLLTSHEMIMTEYSMLQYDILHCDDFSSIILDIDLDFWAQEMGIEWYEKTINQVRKLMVLPQVWSITIATSPTYIDQQRALQILHDLIDL